jgi:hypothetical protein
MDQTLGLIASTAKNKVEKNFDSISHILLNAH